MARAWSLLLCLGDVVAFGGLNQLTYADRMNFASRQRDHQEASVAIQTQNPTEYSNGHFNSEYPSQYIINQDFADRLDQGHGEDTINNHFIPTAMVGRRLDDMNADEALLEAAKAGEPLADASVDVETPALLTEV